MIDPERPGYFTTGEATPDQLILEARYILARRYQRRSRIQDAFECFFHGRDVRRTLDRWNDVNAVCGAGRP